VPRCHSPVHCGADYWTDSRYKILAAVFFAGVICFFLIYFGQFWFFLTRFVFTITDFGDDVRYAPVVTKSVIIIIRWQITRESGDQISNSHDSSGVGVRAQKGGAPAVSISQVKASKIKSRSRPNLTSLHFRSACASLFLLILSQRVFRSSWLLLGCPRSWEAWKIDRSQHASPFCAPPCCRSPPP
jgi:hypothetical protein